ncbi:YlaI family protein [Lentibacillus halophilus]|uniref:YlaI family protein n=1 Tax=Lentibacillus halophilus TaxID=295065 RepID=A0ABN0ZFK2_9BACI
MKVTCALCDTLHDLQDDSLQAKRLRNRRISMYLCEECNGRIYNKTKKRHETGQFQLYNRHRKKKDLI